MFPNVKYFILVFCASLVGCTCLSHTPSKYLAINDQLEIEVPSECMISDENLKAMMCISNNNEFYVGIHVSTDFQKNIISSEYKEEVDDLYYGTFVRLGIKEKHLIFFHIKDSNVVVEGDDKDFILKFSLGIYNEIHRKANSKIAR